MKKKSSFFSGIKLNWNAISSFVGDVKTKDDITAEDMASAIRTPEDQKEDSRYYEPKSIKKVEHQEVTRSDTRAFKNKESLEDIAADIDACDSKCKKYGIYPLLRVNCDYNGEPKIFWFTNHCVSLLGCPEMSRYGQFVPKNSDVAVKIQTTDMGKSFEHIEIRWKRPRKVVYGLENRSDFQNRTIEIAGDSILYQYRDIRHFLQALRENHKNITDVEEQIGALKEQTESLKHDKSTASLRGQITRTINELQRKYRILTEQQEDLKNITIYIRNQGEMRYAPIVDVIQTRIKTQNIFDGVSVIIDGGPGTGKSTTMIHRLAYLTDLFAINEDEKNKIFKFHLTTLQRNRLRTLIETQRDWMFFSPSKLLKEYLADAMNKEGLKNTSEKVWNWNDYRTLILQEHYHLLGENNAPFRICHLTGTLFFQGSRIIDEFMNFYLMQFRGIPTRLPNLEMAGKVYEWTAIALRIKERLENSRNYNLNQFVSLFLSLESLYAEDCKKLLKEKNELIDLIAKELVLEIECEKETKDEISDLLDLASNLQENDDEEENEDDAMDDTQGETTEQNLNKSQPNGRNDLGGKLKVNSVLFKEIRKWLKAFCVSRIGIDTKMSDVHQLMSDIILPLMGDKYGNLINKISELLVFEQYAQYTTGIKRIMLNVIPSSYKKFRTYLLQSQFEGCDLKLMREIMKRKQGKELHHQEQALLLGFVNSLVKLILTQNKDSVKHTYIDAYEEVNRPIIGVDEATDFSACDIYAMQSLLSLDFYSLTLCGDMMQRMTPYGIKSWAELDGIVPEPKIVEMKTSYRQSKKVLEVARKLYIDTMHVTPKYSAYMTSGKVPEPLLFVSPEEDEKIEWISKRITEVFRAYGELLPSIAIFVNDRGYIPNFIEKLQYTDFFLSNNVKILDGSSYSKTEQKHISVYPIDVVKGMEFDVVFFHNIDNSSEDVDLLKRYIYVGISRAAFFLGITLNQHNAELDKYFVQNKDWFKI